MSTSINSRLIYILAMLIFIPFMSNPMIYTIASVIAWYIVITQFFVYMISLIAIHTVKKHLTERTLPKDQLDILENAYKFINSINLYGVISCFIVIPGITFISGLVKQAECLELFAFAYVALKGLLIWTPKARSL